MNISIVDIILQSREFLIFLAGSLLVGAYQLAMALYDLMSERRLSEKVFDGADAPEGTLVGEGLRLIEEVGERAVEEIEELRKSWRSRFERRLRTAQVMSDVAGGFGLLGTVWGMYLTFFEGAADKTTILTGMGVALSTTLVGLAVSILLVLAANAVSSRLSAFEEQASLWLLAQRKTMLRGGAASSANGVAEEKKKSLQPE